MRGVTVIIPNHALQWLANENETIGFHDRLATDWTASVPRNDLPATGLALPDLPPCSALYLELR